jgi:hypothetical protein
MLGHHRPGLRETGAANPRGEESRPLGGDTAARANRGERVQRRAPRARAPPAHAYQHISGNRSSTARTRRDPSIRSARCMPAIPKEGRVGGGCEVARAAPLSALSTRGLGGPLFGSPLPHRPGERRLSPAPRRARGEGASARSPARRAARPRERAARGSHLVRGVRVLALRRGLLSDVGQRAHRLFVRLRVGARVGEGGGRV